MKKKSIMMLLCIALTGSLLTGCGDTKKEQKAAESKKKTEAVSSEPEQTMTEQMTEAPEDTVTPDNAQTTKKPVQTPTARKNTSKNTKATEAPQASDAVEPKDMMTFLAKIENACPNMKIKALYISSYGENAWSDNLLKSSIAYGKISKKIKLRMPADQLRWDLKVITADGKKVIFHELDVSECDSSHITITLMYDEDDNPVAIAV